MKRWLQRLAAAALILALPLAGNAAHAAPAEDAPAIGAGGAVLMDVRTRKVLYAKTAHEKLPMASTTKVMTALLAIESGRLDALVTVPKEAYGVEGSSMYLRLGEEITLRDLVYGLMLVSGNDAAVAIAVALGGSVEGFAAMMNEKAAALGALNTHFVTPNGLHDGAHYTTAYDLALITAYAMENATFREIVGTTYHRTTSGEIVRTMKNKNKLLWEYEGGNGVKTGYTTAAGKCLVFSAERDGMLLVGVVLDCPDMFPSAKALLDYGFAHYEPVTLVAAGDAVARVRVIGGRKTNLALAAKEDIIILVKDSGAASVRTTVAFKEDIRAPIAAGEALALLEVWEDGRLLASTSLIATEAVESTSLTDHLEKLFRRWTA